MREAQFSYLKLKSIIIKIDNKFLIKRKQITFISFVFTGLQVFKMVVEILLLFV